MEVSRFWVIDVCEFVICDQMGKSLAVKFVNGWRLSTIWKTETL